MATIHRTALTIVLLHLAASTLTTASGPLTARIDDKLTLAAGHDSTRESAPDWSYKYNKLGDLVVIGNGVEVRVFAEWESGVVLED